MRWILLSLLPIFFLSCKEEKVPKRFYPRNAHEAYSNSLKKAQLSETALGSEWILASQNSLEDVNDVSLPFSEAIFVENRKAVAKRYQFEVHKGQKILVSVEQIDLNEYNKK